MRTLTVEQVAARLHVKPMTVREYLRRGKIRGRRLGKRWLILEADLNRLFVPEAPAEEEVPPNVAEWRSLSQEEKQRRLDAVIGKYAHLLRPTEEFMREKQEELDREEERWQERHGSERP